ncbi:hypothetical protein F5Y17DRAFT_414125 [Xylariaceae sp. FL0594]|nr:hypothetical protein F5Y17DRAFT_414125 [Xylariaceae sp. FL0594]
MAPQDTAAAFTGFNNRVYNTVLGITVGVAVVMAARGLIWKGRPKRTSVPGEDVESGLLPCASNSGTKRESKPHNQTAKEKYPYPRPPWPTSRPTPPSPILNEGPRGEDIAGNSSTAGSGNASENDSDSIDSDWEMVEHDDSDYDIISLGTVAGDDEWDCFEPPVRDVSPKKLRKDEGKGKKRGKGW